MTLDEAIKHEEEVADLCEYEASKYDMSDSYESHVACQEGKCAKEHRQLAEWLKELKCLKEQEHCENWHDVPCAEMTLEQARQAVKDLRKKLAECLEQEPCDNAISRQAAKRILEDRFLELQKWHDDKRHETNYFLNTILELPSVNPQPKTGHWIEDEDEMKVWCSECCEENDGCSKYCPNCGVRMIESQESEE